MKDLIILKIGGSLITKKHEEKQVDYENLKRISYEISRGFDKTKNKLVLLHGAGSYGHIIVKETGIHKGIKNEKNKLDFAETQRLQNSLDSIVCKEMIKNGLPAIPVQPSSSSVMNGKELEYMGYEVVEHLVDMEMIPVLYGVPSFDRQQSCSILSGDDITVYLAKKLGAGRIIHATDVDGVFTANPKKCNDAELIKHINSRNFGKLTKGVSGSSATDVTGGMKRKIRDLLDTGSYCEIINGNKKGFIERALSGEKGLGTVIY